MQTISGIEIMPGVNLTCVRTEKFKTGCLSVSFLTPLEKKTAPYAAVIMRVLRRGSAMHPDMESISAALDGLYGARIEPLVRKKGECQAVGFYADFIDDSFVGGGEELLEKTAALMGELILSPATRGGRLIPEYVESERENLLDEIRAAVNDRTQYAVTRLLQQMCRTEAYGVPRLGTEEHAKKISTATLTKYYRQLISSSPVEVFYCGALSPERVERAVRSALSALPRIVVERIPETFVKAAPKAEKPKLFDETLDVSQGKLAVGFRLGAEVRESDYPALTVLNAVYGGSVTSKLFMNVREKLSLCYFASSMMQKQKGVMLVVSGIETSKYDEALGEIMAQLDAVKRGEISDEELDAAKSYVVSSISSATDSQYSLDDMYLDRAVFSLDTSPEENAALCSCVTKQQVIEAAQKIKADSICFLHGKEAAV